MQYRIGRLLGRFVVTWVSADGKRRRHRLDALTRKDAEAAAVDLIRQLSRPEGGSLTVADLWTAFRDEYTGRRIAANMEWSGRSVLPRFGHYRPDQITPAMCDAYAASRKAQGRKAATAHTELGHLRICLTWAARRRLIERAPYIKKPPAPMPRERWLTRAEIERLLAVDMEHHVRLAILLMASTAARSGALFDLTWDRVDLDRGQINLRLPTEGQRKGRAVVPMNATLRAALTFAQKAALSDYVIEWAGKPVKSIKGAFGRAVAKAGLVDVTPHDLRRSAARLMVEAGIPIIEVAQFLGQSDTATTFRVYGRFSEDYLRGAAEVLDFTKLRRV